MRFWNLRESRAVGVIDSRGDLAAPVHRDAHRKFSVRDGTADLLGRVQQVGDDAGPNLLNFLERALVPGAEVPRADPLRVRLAVGADDDTLWEGERYLPTPAAFRLGIEDFTA